MEKSAAKILIESLKLDTESTSKNQTSASIKLPGINTEKLLASTTFEELKLSEGIINKLHENNIDTPSKIQKFAVTAIINDNNVICHSESGSGKTIAFIAGLGQRITACKKNVMSIILCPTKELVIQTAKIATLITDLKVASSTDLSLKSTSQLDCDVIVTTAGFLKNLIVERRIKLRSEIILVFDEADVLLDRRGQAFACLAVLKEMRSSNLQLCFFSATYNLETNKVIDHIIKLYSKGSDEEKRSVAKIINEENTKPEEIKLFSFDISDKLTKTGNDNDFKKNNKKIFDLKVENLKYLLDNLTFAQCLIFTSKRSSVNVLVDTLSIDNYSAIGIHGDLTDAERKNSILKFKNAEKKILIATDVLSRGVDIPQINLVINFDLPFEFNDHETYIHRIGRSGRFGRDGFVVDFVVDDLEKERVTEFAKKLGVENQGFFKEEFEDVLNEEDEFD